MKCATIKYILSPSNDKYIHLGNQNSYQDPITPHSQCQIMA